MAVDDCPERFRAAQDDQFLSRLKGHHMGRRREGTAKRKPVVRRPALDRLLRRLHGSLSLDLLHRDYLGSDDKAYYWATLGHCYVAAEAMYHLWGKRAGYVPYVTKHSNGTTHWWLVNQETGDVLDPTEPQLGGKPFSYHKGRRASFLTARPSRRARELMRRMSRA
jgi:hypothetical protein